MRTLCNGFEMLMKRPCTMVAPAPFSTSTSRFSQYIYAAKNSRSALHGARVQKGDVLRARWSITCEMNGKDVDLYSAELCESISGSEIEDTNRWLEDIEQAYYAIHSLSDKLADLPRIEREARARLTETFLSKQPELLAQLDAVFPRMLAKDEAG
jgi:hypothetical protein